MNPSNDTRPPFGEATDEAVSAAIDGELAAFARDHGTTEEQVLGALEGWPGYGERRRSMQEASRAAGEPSDLDAVTRRRIVQNALDDTRGKSRESRRVGRWTVVAAAVGVIAIVGIGIALIANAGDSSSKASNAAAGKPASGDQGDLGVISRTRLRALLGDAQAQSDVRRAQQRLGAAAASSAPSSRFDVRSKVRGDASAAVKHCAATLPKSSGIVFSGYGTYQGRQVAVVATRSKPHTTAFVMPLDQCDLVMIAIWH